jgi:hypothetical protein
MVETNLKKSVLLLLAACLNLGRGNEDKFDYGLFEDPINTRTLYQREQKLLSELDGLRHILKSRREAVKKVLNVPVNREAGDAPEDSVKFPIDALKVLNRTLVTRYYINIKVIQMVFFKVS